MQGELNSRILMYLCGLSITAGMAKPCGAPVLSKFFYNMGGRKYTERHQEQSVHPRDGQSDILLGICERSMWLLFSQKISEFNLHIR